MTLENVNSASWSEFHKIKKIQTELVLKIKGSKSDHIEKIKIFNVRIVFLKKLKSMFSFSSIIMYIFINKINEYI